MKSAKAHKTRMRLQQPPSSFADCTEKRMDEDVGKDFRTLVNAPLSKGGHFVFKSEKTWSVNTSQYSEFFTLNLKMLSDQINCIPFNEYIDVDDKYFTNDQLTNICNNADESKAIYNSILNDLNTSDLSDVACSKNDADRNTTTDQWKNLEPTTNAKSQSEDSIDNLEEDIDFLLSLKEPVQSGITTITQPISISHNNDSKQKPKNIANKPIDLEKWLDFVLTD